MNEKLRKKNQEEKLSLTQCEKGMKANKKM